MVTLIQYIATYAPWIYFVCGVIALYQLYRTWLVRAERRQAVFSLEREKAVRDMGSIFSTALLLLLAMGITYFTSTTLVKALGASSEVNTSLPLGVPGSAEQLIPTPITTPLTPVADATTNAILGPTQTPLLQTTVDATTTETPTATTPTPAAPTATLAPIVQSPVCADQRSVISRPGMNETVRGNISVVGTAAHDNFQFYKIEYAPTGSNSFVYIAGDQNPVINGFLAEINTSTLGNGSWTLQLTVVDQTGNWPDPCQVNILVEN
jgi:hypothetical protein